MRGALMEKHTAVVTGIDRHATDVVTLYFTLEDGSLLDYAAGQYVTVYFDGTTTSEGKAYSLCTAPHEPTIGITVKNIGEYSGKLHALKRGDVFLVSNAYGFFNPNTLRPLVCLCAGVGISPVWSVLKSELRRDEDREAHLFYSNKSSAGIAHLREIDAIRESRVRFRASYHITQEANPPAPMRVGRIVLDECVEAADDARYLLCGSVGFVTAMARGLVERGVASTRISTETFFES